VTSKWAKGSGGPSGDEAQNLVADLPLAFRKSTRVSRPGTAETWVDDGLANTINTFDVSDIRSTHAIVEPGRRIARRLTPVECERLQSFPDEWTKPAGSDSARYKALGNAVTVNTVHWILRRMVQADAAYTDQVPFRQADGAAGLPAQAGGAVAG